MVERPMMKCGHTANAVGIKNGKQVPCCVICGCYDIVEERPSLDGRKAKCSWCDNIVDSDWKLPFFKHKPNCKYDEYYCGCGGWN